VEWTIRPDEQDAHGITVALGYLQAGAALALGPLAVLGYVLWELGVP